MRGDVTQYSEAQMDEENGYPDQVDNNSFSVVTPYDQLDIS